MSITFPKTFFILLANNFTKILYKPPIKKIRLYWQVLGILTQCNQSNKRWVGTFRKNSISMKFLDKSHNVTFHQVLKLLHKTKIESIQVGGLWAFATPNSSLHFFVFKIRYKHVTIFTRNTLEVDIAKLWSSQQIFLESIFKELLYFPLYHHRLLHLIRQIPSTKTPFKEFCLLLQLMMEWKKWVTITLLDPSFSRLLQ